MCYSVGCFDVCTRLQHENHTMAQLFLSAVDAEFTDISSGGNSSQLQCENRHIHGGWRGIAQNIVRITAF